MSTKPHLLAAAILSLGLLSTAANASPTCTTEPEAKWMSQEAMQKKIAELGYKDIKVFKKTTTGCYEIYGYAANGKKAEVYFNPVTGAIIEDNED
jgi:hypothetical protein